MARAKTSECGGVLETDQQFGGKLKKDQSEGVCAGVNTVNEAEAKRLEAELLSVLCGEESGIMVLRQKFAQNQNKTDKNAWMKLRGILEKELYRLINLRSENIGEEEKKIERAYQVLWKHFAVDGPWIDHQPRLGLFLRSIKNLWSNIERIFRRKGSVWREASSVLGVGEQNKENQLSVVTGVKVAANLRVMLGPMPSNKEIDKLLKDNLTAEVRILTLQAPEEATDRRGRALPGYSYIAGMGKPKGFSEKLRILRHSLFDHGATKTSDSEQLQPAEVLEWIQEAIKPSDSSVAGNVILRINCKSGMERSNVVTALLYSYVTGRPLLEAFTHVHTQRRFTKVFDKLKPDLQKLAVNTYFMSLADKNNPQRLKQFSELGDEEISKYLNLLFKLNSRAEILENQGLVEAFLCIMNNEKIASACAKLGSTLPKDVINTYFILLTNTNNPQRLKQFSELGDEEISKYLKLLFKLNSRAEILENQGLAKAFLCIMNNEKIASACAKLDSTLLKDVINTYFMSLADKNNPQRLKQFSELNREEICRYLELFRQANAQSLPTHEGLKFGEESGAFVHVIEQLQKFLQEEAAPMGQDRWFWRQDSDLADFINKYVWFYKSGNYSVECQQVESRSDQSSPGTGSELSLGLDQIPQNKDSDDADIPSQLTETGEPSEQVSDTTVHSYTNE